MMYCFRNHRKSSKKEFEHRIIIHTAFPENPSNYLPNVSEHIVQNEPECVIDDPSSIFYDPHEKPGFVYSAISNYSFSYDWNNKDDMAPNDKIKENIRHRNTMSECSISSEYDDSLDGTRSYQPTPTRKSRTLFDGDGELEFDPIGLGHSFHANYIQKENHNKSNNIDHKFDMIQSSGLSEEEIKRLYINSHEEQSLTEEDLKLYEEALYQCSDTNRIHNKGYLSDAESVKTYQDSGIYDDDVFIESPKALTNDEYQNNPLSMDNKDFDQANHENMNDIERFSAFKTPLSSRHNSIESLNSPQSNEDFNLKLINRKINNQIHSQKKQTVIKSVQEYPQAKSPPLMKPHTWKTACKKYSHIPAKVQSYRSKSDRSLSPGVSLSKKASSQQKQSSKKNSSNSKQPTSNGTTNIKSKIDTFSNIKHTPGGGDTKIFKEKLSFRQKAEPRTDTHGIGMYSNLPEEFQEIARRLARQETQMKKQDSYRGRSQSRSGTPSRHSSGSPTRGRSRTRRDRRLASENSVSELDTSATSSKEQDDNLPTEDRQINQTLSRSSSIRSIPSAPHLSKQHPSTDIRRAASKSPSLSPKVSPARQSDNNKKSKREKEKSLMSSLEISSNPVAKLYHFATKNQSFGSPKYSTNSIYQIAPAVH